MNEDNQAISSYDYDAWGNPMNSTVSEESAYRFTGCEYDGEINNGVIDVDGDLGLWKP